MPSTSDIIALHERLADEFKSADLLGQWTRIRDVNEPNWQQKKFQGEVGFELYPIGAPEYGLTDFNQRVAVFPLADQANGGALQEIVPLAALPMAWVSWFEHWKKLPTEAFTLVTAKWVLFWGEQGNDEKIQVVRAEWDQTTFLENSNSPAAQPHWHVDRDLELAELVAETSALEEIGGGMVSRRVTIQDVHLAMGGWSNAVVSASPAVVVAKPLSNKQRKEEAKKERGRERKKRKGEPLDEKEKEEAKAAAPPPHAIWQRKCDEDIEDLAKWSINTLRYIKSQVKHLRER
jgi:hypothetical protein